MVAATMAVSTAAFTSHPSPMQTSGLASQQKFASFFSGNELRSTLTLTRQLLVWKNLVHTTDRAAIEVTMESSADMYFGVVTGFCGVGPSTIRMEIKRWERKDVKPNSLPIVKKLHVKVGDTVKVIAGHEKGKVSSVTKLFTHNSKIVLKDVNLKTKHVKGKAEGETGQIIQVEAPLHSSNVMLYSKTGKVTSRVGHKTLEDGRKVRYLLKTGEVIDSAEDWNKLHKKEKKDGKKSS